MAALSLSSWMRHEYCAIKAHSESIGLSNAGESLGNGNDSGSGSDSSAVEAAVRTGGEGPPTTASGMTGATTTITSATAAKRHEYASFHTLLLTNVDSSIEHDAIFELSRAVGRILSVTKEPLGWQVHYVTPSAARRAIVEAKLWPSDWRCSPYRDRFCPVSERSLLVHTHSPHRVADGEQRNMLLSLFRTCGDVMEVACIGPDVYGVEFSAKTEAETAVSCLPRSNKFSVQRMNEAMNLMDSMVKISQFRESNHDELRHLREMLYWVPASKQPSSLFQWVLYRSLIGSGSLPPAFPSPPMTPMTVGEGRDDGSSDIEEAPPTKKRRRSDPCTICLGQGKRSAAYSHATSEHQEPSERRDKFCMTCDLEGRTSAKWTHNTVDHRPGGAKKRKGQTAPVVG